MSTRKIAENIAKFANMLPETKRDRTRILKSRAQVLAQAGGKGAPTIKKKLDEEFGAENVPSERTISDWIADSRDDRIESPEWIPWADDQLITDDVGYLLQLNLIKNSDMFQSMVFKADAPPNRTRGLSVKEAGTAIKLQLSLQGLDQFIQMTIVYEYSQRLSFANSTTDDLDLLVATKPWLDEKPYRDLILQGVAPPVEISTLTRPVSTTAFHFGNLVQFWAWQSLNVPWYDYSESQSSELKQKIVKRYKRLELIDETGSPVGWEKKLFTWLRLIGREITSEISAFTDTEEWPNYGSVEIKIEDNHERS